MSMQHDRYQRIAALFDAALDRPADERARFLASACGDDSTLLAEVRALLERDAADLHASVGVRFAPLDADAGADATALPTVPGFRVHRQIGLGGMGVVYEAEQERPRRRVALKLIRPDLSSANVVRRFEREAHILGRLQHPGIAHVHQVDTVEVTYDGGATIAHPYFAMEFVEGASIDTHVANQQMDVPERLDLFARVCDAIDYAHQQQVVHRDLKPGNILVTADGQPKVLDFGIARVIDRDLAPNTLQTRTGELVGTLAYMSPEQFAERSQEIDHRCDVYALGVLLFELLTGELPYPVREASAADVPRLICERDPARLDTRRFGLRNELQYIVDKALEKERDRRYATAGELAADIRRYIRHEPLAARPTSSVYRLRKFVQRNRGLVAGVITTFAALVLGLVGISILAFNLARERDLAEEARRDAVLESRKFAAISSFLTDDLLRAVDPDQAQGSDPTMREVLDRATAALGERFTGQPIVEGALRTAVANLYRRLSDFDQADEQLKRARALLADTDDPARVDALLHTARLELERSRFEQALTSAREALAALDLLDAPTPERRIECLKTLGTTLDSLGEFDQAESLLREAVSQSRELYGSETTAYAEALNLLGYTLVNQGRWEEGEAAYREALRIRRTVHGEKNLSIIANLHNLASLAKNRGDREESGRLTRQALMIAQDILASDHWVIDVLRLDLANALAAQEKLDEAAKLARESVASRRQIYGNEGAPLGYALRSLAEIELKRGELTAAEAAIREGVRIITATHPPDDGQVIVARGLLADVLLASNEPAEAEPHARACYELTRGPDATPALAEAATQRMSRIAAALGTGPDTERNADQ